MESYGFGSTQTRRRTLSACNTFSTCGLRIYHPCVRVRATRVPRTAYERATYGLRESNFTILTCNCCTDSARSTCVPRTVLASSVLTPHFPVDLLNDHADHTCTIPLYKDDLTGGCQLVSKMPRKAQKKTTRQDPKKRAAEDTRAASDDEQEAHTLATCEPRTYTLRVTYSLGRPPYVCRKNVADVATTKTYGQKARTASCDRRYNRTIMVVSSNKDSPTVLPCLYLIKRTWNRPNSSNSCGKHRECYYRRPDNQDICLEYLCYQTTA
ncbi:hypothetical protein Bbelb_355540 [Branchiostoma belcheri]|nr:hypothetical protein Bbelb_355540 [Branchiostoma belcheri]